MFNFFNNQLLSIYRAGRAFPLLESSTGRKDLSMRRLDEAVPMETGDDKELGHQKGTDHDPKQ